MPISHFSLLIRKRMREVGEDVSGSGSIWVLAKDAKYHSESWVPIDCIIPSDLGCCAECRPASCIIRFYHLVRYMTGGTYLVLRHSHTSSLLSLIPFRILCCVLCNIIVIGRCMHDCSALCLSNNQHLMFENTYFGLLVL